MGLAQHLSARLNSGVEVQSQTFSPFPLGTKPIVNLLGHVHDASRTLCGPGIAAHIEGADQIESHAKVMHLDAVSDDLGVVVRLVHPVPGRTEGLKPPRGG